MHQFFEKIRVFSTYPFILVFIAVASLLVVFSYVHMLNTTYGGVITSPRLFSQDTASYLQTGAYVKESLVNGFTPSTDSVVLTRLLTTPLFIFTSLGLGEILGSHALGILFLNIGLYLFSVIIVFNIIHLIFENVRTAFIGTILYITNWCLFSYGTTYLSDMGGWFFFLLTTMYALQFYRMPHDYSRFYLAILTAIIGVFFKEYGALGILSLGFLTLITTLSWQEKTRALAIAACTFGAILFLYYFWFYNIFQWTYFGWWEHNYDTYGGESQNIMYSVSDFVKVVALIFLPAWPLFLFGMWYEWQWVRTYGRERINILLALLPASLTFILWPAFTWRIAFILVPWAILITAHGLSMLKKTWLVFAFLVVYALFNYHIDVLMWNINLPF